MQIANTTNNQPSQLDTHPYKLRRPKRDRTGSHLKSAEFPIQEFSESSDSRRVDTPIAGNKLTSGGTTRSAAGEIHRDGSDVVGNSGH